MGSGLTIKGELTAGEDITVDFAFEDISTCRSIAS
jgi:hypothetical protein